MLKARNLVERIISLLKMNFDPHTVLFALMRLVQASIWWRASIPEIPTMARGGRWELVKTNIPPEKERTCSSTNICLPLVTIALLEASFSPHFFQLTPSAPVSATLLALRSCPRAGVSETLIVAFFGLVGVTRNPASACCEMSLIA